MNLFQLLQRFRRSATIALILSPTGLLIIAVVRLLIIANYNPVTASVIVSSGGYVNTLLGTVIPLVPIFLPYIALTLLFFRRVIPGLLALTATALISPAGMGSDAARHLAAKDWSTVFRWGSTHLPALIPLALVAACLVMPTLAIGFTTSARTVGTIASLALIPYVTQLYQLPHKNNFYAQQVRQPWLPAQMITLASHQQIVGYSLSSDSDWLVVLREDTRRIVYYRSGEIVKRQVCQIGNPGAMRPLVTLTATPTTVPLCVQSDGAPGGQREEHTKGPDQKSTVQVNRLSGRSLVSQLAEG